MAIYIPGMEMPTDKRLTLQIDPNGSVYMVDECSITAETYTTDAVFVSPHGRLIDANVLIERAYKKLWIEPFDIVATPTVIPADEEG